MHINTSFFRFTSINSRIITGVVAVVSMFMILTAYTLGKAYSDNTYSALEERLTGQVYLLMVERQLIPTQIRELPLALSVDMIQTDNSLLSGYVTQADGTILWQSDANKNNFLPPLLKKANAEHYHYQHGKKIFQHYNINGRDYISLSIAIFWDYQNKKFPLIYHVTNDLSHLQQQIRNYKLSLWSKLLFMSVTLLVTLIVILRWGLQPLREVEQEIKSIEQGKQELVQNLYPDELTPLTHNINQLIQFERQQQLRYRNALGDLAHSLKTPLAIMTNQEFNKNKPADYIEGINKTIHQMNSIVEYQLQRAATASPSPHIQYLKLYPIVQILIKSMKKIYQDKQIVFKLDINEDIQFKIDEGDFMEVLGNLIDNACKWCQNQVNISISGNENKFNNRLTMIIMDNGPGIDPGMIKHISKRGIRADQLTPGHGVGLAIVKDIVDVYKGKINFSPSAIGGLEVTIRF